MMSIDLKEIGSLLFVIGKTQGHLHQSEFYKEVLNIVDGPPPEVNLFNEKNNGMIINKLITSKLVNSVHDISSGGILLALSEMCILGKIGAKIKIPHNNLNLYEYLFGEDQSRYLIEINQKNKDEVSKILEENSIYYELLGKTQIDNLELNENFKLNLAELNKLNSSWFKNYFKEK